MPELTEYEVEINGVRTTLQLTAEDAAARGIAGQGGKPVAPYVLQEATGKPAPANKARGTANKRRAAPNKAE
ncbi:hypothetical protein [Nocardia brasiliensis]|uniref:hypothetical protein n=1 Tax=Nocardia brasiliensis TaxID=37326 RepID=UPI00245605D6|nr:hypothetical protein [Nocardia brasiliensis]